MRAFIALAFCVAVATAFATSFTISLEHEASIQSHVVTIDLTNNREYALGFNTRNTPFDLLEGVRTLRVICDGQEVAYNGPLAKRMPATWPYDYITVEGGATETVTIDLMEYFDFRAIPIATACTVDLNSDVIQTEVVTAGDAPSRVSGMDMIVTISPEPVVIVSPAQATRQKPFQTAGALDITFQNCNAQKTTVVRNAHSEYTKMSAQCRANPGSGTSPLYREWFGVVSATRLTKVTNTVNNVANAVSRNLNFYCDAPLCSDSTYAYVYPTDPTLTIHLCGAFWRAPPSSGIDTQPGTVIHELSHFVVFSGTQDHQYGQAGCRRLAQTSPDLAVNNADSYEYFCEAEY